MKKIVGITVLLALALAAFFAFADGKQKEEFIRIHIRANSDAATDQEVKLLVRDALVEYLTPLLANCSDYKDAEKTLSSSLGALEEKADAVLSREGFSYSATVTFGKENFPARSYGELTLDSGIYEALVVSLGEGKGENWWCVAFPPLCFVPSGGKNIVYKSKILELIKKYGDKKEN
jgi:stage II sporulation protein R